MGIKERKEKKKLELKQEILEASVKLFSEHGYEGVSIRKIAEVIEYSPTTVYLYFKDKNEILFELHEMGFRKFDELNQNLQNISNPLLRLHKLNENYVKFGLENPEYYDLMFLIPAPIEFLDNMQNGKWCGGDKAIGILTSALQECMDRKLIKKSELNVMAMTIWSIVHGLVSLTIRKRLGKIVPEKEIESTIAKSLNWIIEIIDITH
jgi:AcrR family transcriptional regulator